MSTPQQQPPKSPTPSKSSLRKTHGSSNSSQRNLLPPPSPRFEDGTTTEVRYSPRSPPNQTLEYDSNEEDGDDEATRDALIKGPLDEREAFPNHEGSYFPVHSDAQEHIPPFEPLFTLVEDNVTFEHHHPSIYYVFADDEQEIITEAALRSLGEDEPGSSSASANATAAEDGTLDHEQDTSNERLPPAQPSVKEHYLILDVHPSDVTQHPVHSETQSQLRSLSRGLADEASLQQDNMQSQSNVRALPFVVSSFTSLSPDWQIQSASITSAPTMLEAPSGEDEGLMLRIEGRGFAHLGLSDVLNTTTAATKGKKSSASGAAGASDTHEPAASLKERDTETLEDMVDRFQNNLNEIRKLIDLDLPMTNVTGINADEAGVDDLVAGHDRSFDFEAQD